MGILLIPFCASKKTEGLKLRDFEINNYPK